MIELCRILQAQSLEIEALPAQRGQIRDRSIETERVPIGREVMERGEEVAICTLARAAEDLAHQLLPRLQKGIER